MSNSIIIIGGTGFLGSRLANFFMNVGVHNITVTGLKRPNYLKKNNVIKLDILNLKELENICKNYDLIINCTGQITDPIYQCYQLNSQGIFNIAGVAKRYQIKVVQISTVAVYGSRKFVDENSFLNPESPYAVCKAYAEFILEKSLPKDKLCILRISNLYGKGSKGLISYLAESYINRKQIFIDNNGNLKRNYIHVNDCAENIVKLLKKRNIYGIYNLIGKETYSVKQLITLFENVTKLKIKIKYLKMEPKGNIDIISDNKIKEQIKLTYKYRIKDYLKSIINNI